jgi:hypothetical protein
MAITLGNGRPSADSVAVIEEELLFTPVYVGIDGTASYRTTGCAGWMRRVDEEGRMFHVKRPEATAGLWGAG